MKLNQTALRRRLTLTTELPPQFRKTTSQHLTNVSYQCQRIQSREEWRHDGKRKLWRRRETAHDPKHTSPSAKHGGGNIIA